MPVVEPVGVAMVLEKAELASLMNTADEDEVETVGRAELASLIVTTAEEVGGLAALLLSLITVRERKVLVLTAAEVEVEVLLAAAEEEVEEALLQDLAALILLTAQLAASLVTRSK